MRLSELIYDFRVRVKVKGANNSIHTRQLSEGEQQLLTVIGLMRFTQDENSLYILDEPDTHLNPAWGLDYLNRLRNIGGINKNSHTILATHDPLLVAGLLKQEIKVLSRADNGRVSAIEPEESPRGTGVAGVLTSELYGLESQLDSFSLKVLKRIYEISMLENYPQKNTHLQRLRKIIPGLTATDTSPDPYRNIAKLAYKQAVELVLNSESNTDIKVQAIQQLSSLLYEETIKGQE
jgi:ABC-type multidrug transport system ATPase subunit